MWRSDLRSVVMTNCRRCQSKRIANLSAKCDDRCSVTVAGKDKRSDYVPRGLGIGGGDYVDFSWCLDCGQMQNSFPLRLSSIEEDDEDAEESMDDDD